MSKFVHVQNTEVCIMKNYDKFLLKIASCPSEGINMFKFSFINFNKMFSLVILKGYKGRILTAKMFSTIFYFNKFNSLSLTVIHINVTFCVEL